ncbi:E3 ubiquitin-protein ligase TRIM71 [Nematostella vectensis]|uniref:E3 ubiquitin-protein ligase TRIM71 n=1 Tax=Nematostella vectensis TaxID=45351 RepID=UPI0020771588|nr:E3 ubiquitin-protein ligase TRIM71 [Nematostella vectensis]
MTRLRDNVLKYFCETCDQANCRDCAIYEHRDYVYVDLKEAVKKYRSSVTHMLDTCKRKIPVLRCAVEEVKEVRRNLQDRVQTEKDNIRATIQNHIQQLEEQAEDLTQTLENMYHNKEKVLTAQQEILELDLSNLLSSSDFTENVLRYGNEAEVMLVKPQMVSRLTHLYEHDSQTEPEENEHVDFSSNEQQLSLMISCLGNVSTSSAFPFHLHAQGFGLTRAKVGQEASFKVIALDRDGEPCQKGDARVSAKIRCPNGFQLTGHVTKNEDSTYTVTYTPSMKGDHELMVMIREKQIKDSPFDLQVGNTRSPFDVQVGNTGSPFYLQIYVIDDKIIRQFGIRGKGDVEIWYQDGVAVDKSGNIFVADHGNNRIQSRTETTTVFKYSTFGSYGDSQGKFNCPRHISVSSKGEILVSDAGNFRVQVFDGAGNFLSKFGEKGSNNGQFSCSAGVATDAEGHIVVADLKNLNVQVFNSEGEFIKRISQDPDSVRNASYFAKPTGVAISDNGNVVVADRGLHKVMLF